jgi:hypothetical protein
MRDVLRDAYVVASIGYVAAIVAGFVGDGIDGHAYWAIRWPHLYPATYGQLSDGFNYSPLVAQVLTPFTALPWPVFHGLVTAASLAALYFLVGHWSVIALLLPPVAIELYAANINLLLAAAIVASFRVPAAWALPILTKVAPGIGVLWFALHRQWNQLAIALGFTVALVAGSFALAPAAWGEWVGYLIANADRGPLPNALPVGLVWRLPLASIALLAGSMSGRRWLVPVACFLATPVIWPATLSLLVACWPLRTREA